LAQAHKFIKDTKEKTKMNIEQLRKELELDEGCKFEIYLDHLGYKTFGIGHLCKATDPENDMEVGTEVSEERVKDCFNKDIELVISDCELLYDDFDYLPEEAKLIISNMMFNIGFPKMKKFVGMKAGVDARDWNKAADEMIDSNYYKQLPNRAGRLVKRMRSLHGSI
jgi:lysozyme